MSYIFTLEPQILEQQLKKLIIQETEKDQFSADEIDDHEPLFGQNSRIQQIGRAHV